MSRELQRAAGLAYGAVTHARRGSLSRAELERLGAKLAPLGTALPVAAAWSAARAVIFPQLDANAVVAARAAVEEVQSRLAADAAALAHKPLPALEALAKLQPIGNDPMPARRNSAALAVAHALACYQFEDGTVGWQAPV